MNYYHVTWRNKKLGLRKRTEWVSEDKFRQITKDMDSGTEILHAAGHFTEKQKEELIHG